MVSKLLCIDFDRVAAIVHGLIIWQCHADGLCGCLIAIEPPYTEQQRVIEPAGHHKRYAVTKGPRIAFDGGKRGRAWVVFGNHPNVTVPADWWSAPNTKIARLQIII